MLINALAQRLAKSEDIQHFWGKLDACEDATMAVASSARPLLTAARFAHVPQATLVVLSGEYAASDFARNVSAYVGESRVLRFFERTDYPFEEKPANARQVACRMQALDALVSGKDVVVVASARSLLRCLPPVGTSFFKPLDLVCGKEIGESAHASLVDFESLPLALEAAGYCNTGQLEGPGSYCVHGDTLDVFPGNLTFPVRIECFGDEVDEIRRIVPGTGQTISSLDQVEIYPVREFVLSKSAIARAKQKLHNPAQTNRRLRELLEKLEGGIFEQGCDALLPFLYEKTASLGDFLPKDALSVVMEPRALIDDCLRAFDEITARAKGSGLALEGLYIPPAKLDFGSNQRCTFVSIMRLGGSVDVELPVKRSDVAGNPEKLFGKFRNLIDAGYTVVFSAPDYRSREDIKLECVDRGLPIVERLDLVGDCPDSLKRAVVNIVDVDIPLGIIIPKAKMALISINDTRGTAKLRTGKRVDITEITFPFKPGDYVVHAAHGVALFKDLVQQEVGSTVRDYLLLEYAAEDKLYVPVEQLDRVTRYVGPEGASPRLTRLNTSDWSRALNRARKASKKLAFDLVDVYTRRAATQGYRYSPDTPWQREMEDSFPYQETDDQLAAIADIKSDMQSARPMDRLLCGDVGFGKTEVALRAAFKATQDNKQVMVLCPTTILAQQHFTTFKDRFEPFGVRVEVLSRFRTNEQQRVVLEDFSQGEVQVLIGTHRLLSRDVSPKDLGLVIIDEEQRFGVGHKEQLKNLRESIDILTLSATPIPRTMQMSLSGVRDMSLILTPPDERRPVKVHVGEWDPDVVSAAIRRELSRKGQVYYVSNRVRSIQDAIERVEQAAPEARVDVAHGQMSKEQLERVMEEFSAGNIDVLVATTIIESGIDNPHTNTLIIEDSQRLGLAQMYQLKGRVGRSSLQAYAYFMFPDDAHLTEEAMARLEAIDEYQDLGSGMRIALRDLEIRGAGDLLGAEQSGNMSAVGFDLFAQMLAEAVNATREGRAEQSDLLPAVLSDITVNIPAHTYIPEEYIREADKRVLLYRQIASAEEVAVVDELCEATRTQWPQMPQATENLFMKARIKALCKQMGIKTITVVGGKLSIEPCPKPTGELWATMRRAKARYVTQSSKLQLPLKYFGKGDEEDSLLNAVFCLLQDLQ